MKKIYPQHYNKFTCIAGDCPDTCCAGWEVVIDKKTQEKYANHHSAAARDACASMYTDSDGDVCLKLKNGRCPMLTDDKLCRIYIEMGKECLSEVCSKFPRFEKRVQDMCFMGISASCPEAARLIIEDKSIFEISSFCRSTQNVADAIMQIFDFFQSACRRGEFFCVAQKTDDIQSELDFGDIASALDIMKSYKSSKTIPQATVLADALKTISEFEILTADWKDIVTSLETHIKKVISDKTYAQKRDAALWEASQISEIANIEIYFLYKYLAEAIDCADIYSCMSIAWTCSAIICEILSEKIMCNEKLTPNEISSIFRIFCKEIEHSEENIGKLYNISVL